MTTDLDIIVDHTKLNKDHFNNHLKTRGFDVTMNDIEAIDEGLHGSFYLKETMFRIDVKGVFTELDQKSIDMAHEVNFEGII